MKATLILCLTTLATAVAAAGNDPYYHTIEAKPGDAIYSILNRYDLDEPDCNVDKFLELNKMKISDPLLAGKEYKLPVMIYTYNGKSIRTTLGITDLEKAKRIANYNRIVLNRNLRKTDYESSKILWVPYHELHCSGQQAESITSKPPAASKSTSSSGEYVSLFGPEYGKVTVKSDKLKGKVYYISAGHGGPDPGAIAKCGSQSICEDEYAYDVSLRLARNLLEHGARVHVVVQDANDGIRNEDLLDCDHDEKTMGTETIPINQLARLKQRTDAVNELYNKYAKHGVKEQYLVCVHVDSRSSHHRQDVFFYYYENSKSGKKLATNVQNVFAEKYARYRPGNEYEGTVSCRNLYELRVPLPTTLYVELANIRNEYDRKRILPSTNRQALANWLYEGLVRE